MQLKCNNCNSVFPREEGAHEAELAFLRGEELGDFVCPNCGSGDHMIEEIWQQS